LFCFNQCNPRVENYPKSFLAIFGQGRRTAPPHAKFQKRIECRKIIVVKMALRLRWESIMTLKWIAQRLHMGSWTHVSNCLATTMK
jgi:hypothetical protein